MKTVQPLVRMYGEERCKETSQKCHKSCDTLFSGMNLQKSKIGRVAGKEERQSSRCRRW